MEWIAFAAFAASLGIYCAVRWPTARTAGVNTGGIGFFFTMLPVFMAVLVGVAAEKAAKAGQWFLLPACISPPVALGVSGFFQGDLSKISGHVLEQTLMAGGFLTSIAVYAGLGRWFWRRACRRFSQA